MEPKTTAEAIEELREACLQLKRQVLNEFVRIVEFFEARPRLVIILELVAIAVVLFAWATDSIEVDPRFVRKDRP